MVDFYLFRVPVKISQITKLSFTTQTITEGNIHLFLLVAGKCAGENVAMLY